LYGHKWTTVAGLSASDDDGYLTDAAAIWADELGGLNENQIRKGINQLGSFYPVWPPGVFEFKTLCCVDDDTPTLDEIIRILVFLPKDGSLAARYKHPLAFAVSTTIDMHLLKTAKLSEAKIMIKPVYQKLIASGWDNFPDYAHDDNLQLPAPKANTKTALSAFSDIKRKFNA